MCITEDHLLSREGWSQLESVEMEAIQNEALVRQKYKETKEPINEFVTATILKIPDLNSEMEQRLDFNIILEYP